MPTTTRSKRKRQESELEQELLHCIGWQSDLDRARELVEIERVNINCANEYGWTPLILAASYQSVQIVRLLLENRASADAANNDGRTALSYAVGYNNVAVAEVLLEYGADVDKQDDEDSNLGYAMRRCNVAMVALLLRFGANTEETLCGGLKCSALYGACWKSTVEIVQLLLNHNGVDVNAFRPRQNHAYPATSPLCWACQRNNMEMAQLLIQRGARVIFDGVYPDVPSPLVEAVEKGSSELLQFLLDNSRFSENGNARLPQVADTNHPLSPALKAAIAFNKLEAAQLLVDRGANANDRAFSFLHRFVRDGQCDRVRFLLRAGANVNLTDRESGETPLWVAAVSGHVEVVKELLKARADVRIRDNNGETPLGVAYRQGNKDIVYLLLRTSPHVWRLLANFFFEQPRGGG